MICGTMNKRNSQILWTWNNDDEQNAFLSLLAQCDVDAEVMGDHLVMKFPVDKKCFDKKTVDMLSKFFEII